MKKRAFARVPPVRARAVFYIFTVVSLFLAWRLFYVQIQQGPALAKAALEQRSDTIDVFARRGSITDRNGNVLVRSLPSQSIYAVPHDIIDPKATVQKLTPILGKLDPQTVALLSDKKAWFVWLARKVSHDRAVKIRSLHLPGIQIKRERTGRRYDAVGKLAANIIGFVGTDENGLDGAEYYYDSYLRGQTGKVTLETDEFGRPIPFGHETTVIPAHDGVDLALTIDSYLQYITERALDEQVAKFHARSGVAIVMDPNTGAVLALANAPSFDPNAFWKASDNARRDRAVMDAYEPGSTYKLVTAAAALSSGKVTTQSRFAARDTLTVDDRVIHNAEDGFMAGTGTSETLEQIIAYSHNVGAAEVGMSIGGRTFYAMEKKAGFTRITNIGLPGENPGIVPPPSQWSGSSLATMSFGQGVAVTPIAMARYYSAIANGGLLYRPRILSALRKHDGTLLYRYHPELIRRVFSPQIAATLRNYLKAVVRYGTGDPAAQIAGYTTAGKTGTAQISRNGVYEPGAYVASFIGMIPADHPRFVILVKVDHPVGSYYGSEVAAPAFVTIARAAMLHENIPPKSPPMPKKTAKSHA